MEEVKKFLSENPNGFMSTVDNGIPRVRPFGFMFEEQGRFYFCTGAQKNVYRQLKSVPHVEFCCQAEGYRWLRLSGGISFSDDIKIKERILDMQPLVKQIYKSADNPIFTVFFIEKGNASISDFSGNPPLTFSF